MGAGVGDSLVDVPVREGGSGTLQARRCGPLPLLPASVAQGCGPARNVTALIGTPSAPASVSSTTDDLGLHVTWVKGSTVPLRRFLVTATYSGLNKGGISFPPAAVAESPIPTPGGQISQDERTITLQEKSVPITMQFSFSAATREAPLPAPDGRSVERHRPRVHRPRLRPGQGHRRRARPAAPARSWRPRSTARSSSSRCSTSRSASSRCGPA